MSIVSEQRIAHFDRPAKLRNWKGLRSSMSIADVRKRRGGPSGSLSHEFAIAESKVLFDERRGQNVAERKARLEFVRLRERMLEQKRDRRAQAKLARRPTIKSKINRSRGQREYIRWHEEQQARWKELDAQLDAIG
jgi:hypothetical protein